jgi:hypothetical protein
LSRFRWRDRGGLALVTALAALSIELTAQALSVAVNGDAVHVRAPSFRFLQGDVLSRLHDGRAVRFDVRLDILAQRDGPAAASTEQSFNVSFDLWEERFAVTRLGQPVRSVTHLTSAAAEAWCLDNVTVPLASLGAARAAPVWVRLTLRSQDEAPSRRADPDDDPFSMRHLIDALSRRRQTEDQPRTLEGGPFRLMN